MGCSWAATTGKTGCLMSRTLIRLETDTVLLLEGLRVVRAATEGGIWDRCTVTSYISISISKLCIIRTCLAYLKCTKSRKKVRRCSPSY